MKGKIRPAGFIGLLQNAGFGDSLVRFLEAQAVFQQKNWKEAIARFETARALLAADPQLIVQLDLMLAECYGRAGDEEQRLEALRRAAEGGGGPESARVGLAQALARSGKLDQAAATLLPLVKQRPEWRLDLVRLLLQWTIRQPRDRRNWPEVERSLREAEKALPRSVEPLTLLRLDLLVAQDRLEDARGLLSAVLAKDPNKLSYRLALARLTQRRWQGQGLRHGECPRAGQVNGSPNHRPSREGPGAWSRHPTGPPGLLGPRGGRRGPCRGGEAGGGPPASCLRRSARFPGPARGGRDPAW